MRTRMARHVPFCEGFVINDFWPSPSAEPSSRGTLFCESEQRVKLCASNFGSRTIHFTKTSKISIGSPLTALEPSVVGSFLFLYKTPCRAETCAHGDEDSYCRRGFVRRDTTPDGAVQRSFASQVIAPPSRVGVLVTMRIANVQIPVVLRVVSACRTIWPSAKIPAHCPRVEHP